MAELLLAAEFLDDVERVRIASENRLRNLLVETGHTVPKGLDGKQLVAFGLAAGAPYATYAKQAEAMARLEHEAELQLARVLRRHPLGPWVSRTVGIGAKQGARLLAAIGPVSWNALEGRPRRGPAELWAYCGYVPGQRRRKGVRSNWNAQAKMRAFLVAQSCIKQRHSPYRATYDAARASWAGRGVSDGYVHNHALRVTAKAVLRDLFVEARRLSA